ncbi:MAG: PKD domain-containing protein [Cyclobacteriaceae bacterium]
MGRIFLLFLFLTITPCILIAQCPPDKDIILQDQYCRNQPVDIADGLAADSYLWDFCTGDLQASPAGSLLDSNSAFSNTMDISLKQDANGQWFGFSISRRTNQLTRLEFGDDLSGIPAQVDLNNPGSLLLNSYGLDIIRYNSNYYGFVVNAGRDNLVVLSFGTSLSSFPSASSISLDGEADTPERIRVIEHNNELIAFIANSKIAEITRVNLGSEPTGTPVSIDRIAVPGINSMRGIDLIQSCDSWKAIVTGYSSKDAYLVDLGADPAGVPVNTDKIAFADFGNSLLSDVAFAADGNQVYALIQERFGRLFRVNFGEEVNASSGTLDDLGKIGGMDNAFGFDVAKAGSSVAGFSIDFVNQNLYRFDFPDNCPASLAASSVADPSVSYSSPGTYYVSLTTSTDGTITRYADTVTISAELSPEPVITAPRETCTGSEVILSAAADQSVATWTWEIDGATTSGQTISQTFTEAGEYVVRLAANGNNGCPGTTTDTITVYETPIPDFTIPDNSICTDEEITFSNLTSGESGPRVQWAWSFGNGDTSSDKDPSFAYTETGTYTVRLSYTLADCSGFVEKEIEVTQGPSPSFTFNNSCVGDIIDFTNTSEGQDITEYFWDFSDGTTSTVSDPVHRYEQSGVYSVSLTVTSANGCQSTDVRQVEVLGAPFVDFVTENACSGAPVQLTDQSDAGEGNIVSWRWEIQEDNETTVYTDQYPVHTFDLSGSVPVKLIVTNNTGCTDSLTQNITIRPSPQVDFEVVPGCPGEPSRFFDRTVLDPSLTITSRLWIVNGRLFNQQNPQYIFPEPGTYQVTLSVDADNACSAAITREVTIEPAPSLNFSLSSACSGQPVTIVPEFSDENEIASVSWEIPGIGNSTEINPVFIFPQPGVYSVSLTATTAEGCLYSFTQNTEILPSPAADFTFFPAEGRPPLSVRFFNRSTGATAYEWYHGQTLFSTEAEPQYTIVQEGPADITLITKNEDGCTDSLTRTIVAVDPSRDLELMAVQLVQDETGGTELEITVRNNSQISVEEITVDVETSGLSLSTTSVAPIGPGETLTFTPNLTLNTRSIVNAGFVCITVSQPGFTEVAPDDNQLCQTLEQPSVFIAPYPSPVRDSFTTGIVAEDSGELEADIINASGETVRKVQRAYREGRTTFVFSTQDLPAGIYIVRLQTNSHLRTFKVLVLR